MAKRDIKIGVHLGAGPPPGYLWSVHILDVARGEAREFLNEDQYQHASQLVRELAREADPSHSVTQKVDPIEEYFELSDKGGILARINLRVFFHLDPGRSVLLVLGAVNKKNDGPTRMADRIRMRNRLRRYLRREYDGP